MRPQFLQNMGEDSRAALEPSPPLRKRHLSPSMKQIRALPSCLWGSNEEHAHTLKLEAGVSQTPASLFFRPLCPRERTSQAPA